MSRYFAPIVTEADLFARYCRTISRYSLHCIMERNTDDWRADVAGAELLRREEARLDWIYPAP